MPRLCILAPSAQWFELAGAEREDLARLFGNAMTFRCWNDAGDLAGFDLVSPLLAWGYHRDPAGWFALLDQWEAAALPFANPLPLVRWNSDKTYLFDLERSGVPIVPTRHVAALDAAALADAAQAFGPGELIVKPAISGGSDDTYRLPAAPPRDAAIAGPIPAGAAGRPMLIQPLMPGIVHGELSLIFFGGRFSHAIVKRGAPGEFRVQEQFGGSVAAIEAPAAALSVAEAAIAACPLPPVYARVDLVADGIGFALMEIELIEPSLFLRYAPDGGARLASALLALCG